MVNVYEKLNELSEIKESTCKACPLYLVVNSREICNPNLYLNTEDKITVSSVPAEGYKRGCGCGLKSKWANSNSTCPLRKW